MPFKDYPSLFSKEYDASLFSKEFDGHLEICQLRYASLQCCGHGKSDVTITIGGCE